MQESFYINPRVIAHLGEDLIKNESIALLELVKNSYDACANYCEVNFEFNNDKELISLSITDDGFGMSINTIQNVWLVIGTDFKYQKVQKNCCGRAPLGEKGIGRLGIHKLGNKILLISKTETDNEVMLEIDWTLLNKVKKVSDFPINIAEQNTPQYFKNNTKGTKIFINELKTKWDKRQLREVYRNLASLNSPFSGKNDSFIVNVNSNNMDIFAGLPSFNDIKNSGMYFGHCKMHGNTITKFEYRFKPWSSLEKIDKGRKVSEADLLSVDLILTGFRVEVDEKGKTHEKEYIINLDDYKIGDIEFDIIIYETESQILNYANIEKSSLKDYLKENGGIRVYRDNVRVYDYGENGNDWLGIDLKRVSRVGGNVSNNIILGSVRLDRLQSYGLKEKTNREGFIENDSYKAFVDAINCVLSLFVRERNLDKHKLSILYKKDKMVEPVLSDLNDVMELVKSKINDTVIKDEILKYLYRINTQYKDVKEVLIKSANAGLNLSVVIHEIEKQVSALIGFAEKGEVDRIKAVSLHLEKIVNGYSAMIRKSDIGKTLLSEIVRIALDNYEFRFSDHKIEVFSNYKECKLKAYLAEAESISVLTNLLDNAIFWLSYARTDNRKLVVYITDQINDYHSIIVADNGPGFKIAGDIAIQPFITGKPHNKGMGLGLHIANEMMKAMKGKLLFLDEFDVEFSDEIKKNQINKAIVALCFPKER